MGYFGDESGGFRSLLNGEDEYIAHAVIRGQNPEVAACPKKTVRDIRDISEAKWNDLKSVQKRRFIDCVEEREIEGAYSVISKNAIERLAGTHLLYQNSLEYRSSIIIQGVAYAALLASLNAASDADNRFQFDRFYSQKQSAKVIDVLSENYPGIDASDHNSRKVKGIQTADCIAGAAREEQVIEGNRLTRLALRDETDYVLSKVEKLLHDEMTGP